MHYILFADADGTLLHKVGGLSTKTIDGTSYIAESAIDLIGSYKGNGNLFVVSTGRRASRRASVSDLLNPDYLQMEHGSVIYQRDGRLDVGWSEMLAKEVGKPGTKEGLLWTVEREFQAKHFITDSKGRLASFRVGYAESIFLSEEQKEEARDLVAKLAGDVLTTTINEGMLDIIPAKAGKANAALYLVTTLGLDYKSVLALVNDVNDTGLAGISSWVACPSNAPTEIKKIVQPKGYVSSLTLHKGTVDLLEHVIERVSK